MKPHKDFIPVTTCPSCGMKSFEECSNCKGDGVMKDHYRCAWCYSVAPKHTFIERHNKAFCCIQCLLKWEAHNG